MISSLSPREQRLFVITLVIVGFGLLYIGYNLFSNIEDADLSASTQGRFVELFEKIHTVDDQKRRNANLRERLGNTQGEFISETQVGKLFVEIERLAGRHNVNVQNITTRINQRATPMPSLEVDLTMQCQFEQLIAFLDSLRSAQVVVQPASLRTSLSDPNQPNLQVQLKLKTFLIDSRPASGSPLTITRGGVS